MRRTICLYVIFLPDGRIKNYHKRMITQLHQAEIDMIVIVNGMIDDASKEYLLINATSTLFRENVGYDAGAFKDYFALCTNDDLREYDQCILMNDTFCGPFCPWIDILGYMNTKAPSIDFWGFSKYLQGYSELLEDIVPEHVQSYFLCISKRMFRNPCFWEFWESFEYPKTFTEAVQDYEVQFTRFFAKRDFTYTVWLDEQDNVPIQAPGEIIFTKHPGRLISEYNFPILKRKACKFIYYREIMITINNCIGDTTVKDVAIDYYIDSLRYTMGYSINEIDEFVKAHERVFIYGDGNYASNLKYYLADRGLKYNSVITTEKEKDDVIKYSEISFLEGDGIIVAINKVGAVDVIDAIRKDWPTVDLFCIDR